MPRIMSLDDLNRLKIELVMQRNQAAYQGTTYVTVGMGTCGIASGALEVFRALEDEIRTQHVRDVVLSQTGCLGLCKHEPILEVVVGDAPKVVYGKVDPALVKRIVQEHILDGKAIEEFVIDATPFPTI